MCEFYLGVWLRIWNRHVRFLLEPGPQFMFQPLLQQHMLDHFWTYGGGTEQTYVDYHLWWNPKGEHSLRCEKSGLLAFTARVFTPRWLTVYEGNYTVSFTGLNPQKCGLFLRLAHPISPTPLLNIHSNLRAMVLCAGKNWDNSGMVIDAIKQFSGLGLVQGQQKLRSYHRAPALLLAFFFS